MRERLYSEKEIGRLIQRASEIQREAAESEDRGLAFHEVEHIASEIGIDASHVRQAMAELEARPEADSRSRIFGGPFELEQSRVVEGTVTEEQWERIVLGLRRLTGSTGTVSEVGQIREWTRTTRDLDLLLEQMQVSINPREAQATISVRQQYRGGAIVAYVAGILVSGAVAGAFLDSAGLSELVNTIVLGGSGIGGFAAARTSIALWSRRQRRRLKNLTDWVHETLSQPEAASDAVRASAEVPEVDDQDMQPLAASERRVGT